MLEQISWSLYLTFIAFLTFLYYGWVYLKYFRGMHPNVSAANISSLPGQYNSDHFSSAQESFPATQVTPELSSRLVAIYADMLNEMEAFIEQADNLQPDKIVFLNKLRLIAGKYKAVKDAADKIVLTQIIQQKSRLICSSELSDEEMAYVWGGA